MVPLDDAQYEDIATQQEDGEQEEQQEPDEENGYKSRIEKGD